jgi:tetratricopeptide (TPR) repeat protein
MGLIYNGQGEYELAIQEFQEALEMKPGNSNAYRGLAAAYEQMGDLAKAEEYYKYSIDINPDYWAGYNDLGNFYYNHGKYTLAAEQFKEVTVLLPENTRGYNNQASMYFYLGEWEKAKRGYLNAIAIQPNTTAYSNLGTIFFHEQNYRRAAENFKAAVEMNPNNYQLWGNLGACYHFMKGKSEEKRTAFEKAVSLASQELVVNPKDYYILAHLADYHQSLGNRHQSLVMLSKIPLEMINDTQILNIAAEVYEQLGERDTALKYVAKALKLGFPLETLEQTPDMANLLKDPRFVELCQSIQSDN